MKLRHTTQAHDRVKAIPKARRRHKIIKSAFGLAIMGAALYGAKGLGLPWPAWLSVFFVGAHIVSEDLTRASVQYVVGIVKDVLASVAKRGEA